jgi:tetratricopeptide (TPR) repeat protein
MEWLYDFGLVIWDWFGDEDHQNRVTAIATSLTVILTIAGAMLGALWYVITRLIWHRNRPENAPDQPQPAALPQGDVLSMDQHLTILQKREEHLEARLSTAHAEEKDLLQRQITELQAQIANPEESLAKAQKRIADLEALLDREANQIGADRIAEAKAALEQGDYSLADDIFAEIEAKNELAVQETARAAYGRGEVAEAEVRWGDAHKHYANAARLDPSFDNLRNAREFAWRAGDYTAAHRYGEALLAFARKDGTQEQLSLALNEHALTVQAQGRYAEAEGLFREALDIDRATIGEGHPSYAIHLNNLANAVRAQRRHAEAEGLYREAVAITREAVGEGHPTYAIQLNNLAGVVQAQGRHEEAEGLYREALEIDRVTIGERHPDYAIHLSNLAGVVRAQGRYAEAEELYREALEIDRATIGDGHPDYAIDLNNLAGAMEAQGRYAEAEGLYREALEIGRATIGTGHPDYAIDLNNLAGVLVEQGKPEEARPLYEQALEIFRATLPPDHPYIAGVQAHIANLP